MKLVPGRLMYGVDPLILRDGMRSLLDGFGTGEARFHLAMFAQYLGAPVNEAAVVLQQMCADGCFAECQGKAGHIEYRPEAGFFRITAAPVSHGISRREADNLLKAVLAKVSEIEQQPDSYWHRVSRLVVFGSYLTDKEILGDLDIGFELERTQDDRATCKTTSDFHSFYEDAYRRKIKTERALRLRRPNKISLHKLDELDALAIEYRKLIWT